MSTELADILSNPVNLTSERLRMDAADEQQLIDEAKGGNHEAFRRLVERNMKQAYNIAYSVVNNHHHAEEITQDAFVRVHRSLHSFRGDASFQTWLYRIIMNLSINRMKQRRARAEREVDTPTEGLTVAIETDDAGDVRRHIERALHELPTLQRAVVILRHLDGLSTRQVSSILNCSEGTVKTHLYRGLRKLKRTLNYLEHS
jgi:RNA polymerase sigma-70 factor (ECF subfamily)